MPILIPTADVCTVFDQEFYNIWQLCEWRSPGPQTSEILKVDVCAICWIRSATTSGNLLSMTNPTAEKPQDGVRNFISNYDNVPYYRPPPTVISDRVPGQPDVIDGRSSLVAGQYFARSGALNKV